MSESEWWQTETNDSVATKPKLWRPIAEKVGGFDLDPAAGCEPTPIAENRYTEADDGLSSPWFGNVWLNPPFSDKAAWYKRLVGQYNHGDVTRAVVIATADTSANWFHNWFATADILCLLDGRDWYTANGDSPAFATQLGIWNPTDELISYLHRLGTVVEPHHDTNQTTL